MTAVLLLASAATAQSLLKPEAWDWQYDMICRDKLTVPNVDVFYMCRPSFSPEYALSFELYRNSMANPPLVLKRAGKNLWYFDNWGGTRRRNRFNRRKYPNVEVDTYQLTVSKETSLLIHDLVKAANETASYFNGEMDGCDGTTYYFHSLQKYGSVWEPVKGSRTGRLVAVMDSLCQAVEQADTVMVYRQLPACRRLLREFREDYPMADFKSNWILYSRSSSDTSKVERVMQHLGFLHFSRVFSTPVTHEAADEWYAPLRDRVAMLSRQLFILQDSLQIRSIDLQITDGQPDEYFCGEYDIPNIRLSDTVDFEAKCLSAPLQKHGFYRRLDDGTWQPADTAGTDHWWNWPFFR